MSNIDNSWANTPYEAQLIQSKKDEDTNYGITDMFADGWKANAWGIGRINHPASTAYQADFSLAGEEEQERLMSLPGYVRESVIDFNPRNQEEFEAVIARTEDEVKWQEDIYNYGGLPASLGANIFGGVLQPDIFLAGPIFKAGKAIGASKQAAALSGLLRKKHILEPAKVAGAGAGVAGIGLAVEATRQETSGVSFEDDLYNVAMLGMVLGSGAKATSNFMAKNNQSRITKAMDADIKETKKTLLESKYTASAGPMRMDKMKWSEKQVRIEDVSMMPSTGAWGKLNVASVRGRLYNVMSPKTRNAIEWMFRSNMPLKNKDGSFYVQGHRSIEDIIDTTYKGVRNDLRSQLRETYAAYKASTDNPLDEYEFGREVYRERINATFSRREHIAEIKYYKEAIEELAAKIPKVKRKDKIKTQIKELEAKVSQLEKIGPKEHVGTNDFYVKGNKALEDYYAKMDKSRQTWLLDKEAKNIDKEGYKSYMTRLWNKSAIARMKPSEVVAIITKAIKNSPTALMLKRTSSKAYEQYIKDAPNIAEGMAKKISEAESLNELLDYIPKQGTGLTTSRFNIGRKIDVDERMLGDLIQDNVDDITELYHRDMAGKMAFKEAMGISTKREFKEEYVEDIVRELRDLGKTPKEIKRITDDIDVALDTLFGTRSLANDPDSTGQVIKRFATGWNNITLGMGFGWTALLEIGPALALAGVRGLSYLQSAVSRVIDKYKGTPAAKPIYNQLKAMGTGMDVYNSRVASRFTDDGINFAHGKMEMFVERNQARVMHGSGLIGVTDAYKDMIGMAYIHNLHELGRELNAGGDISSILSRSEQSRLARHGLSIKDIQDMGRQDVIYKDGLLEDLNWDNWDMDLKDKLSTAVNRAVKGNILEPSTLDLPKAMTDADSVFVPLMMQYLRFPIAATENYLLRALSEQDKAAAIGGLVSVSILGSLELGKDSLLTSMGLQKEDKYSFDDPEKSKALAWKLFNYNPYAGFTPTLANIGHGLAGEPQPGSTYTPRNIADIIGGPTYSRASGLLRVLQHQVDDPGEIGKQEMYLIKMNTPFAGSVPILRDIQSEHIRENY